MQPFFDDYLERLAEIHRACHQALSELPAEAINWKPQAGMNSLAVLITHLTGAERFWIGDVAADDPSDRVRAAEFAVTEADAASLTSRLEEVYAYAENALQAFSVDMLSEKRLSRVHNLECTVGWALLHALEHSALHCGHVQLTRQMWERSVAGYR